MQQELLNLRRENKLITSAWYDLTCRLQSNTVVLQRRSEAPKSWLGRQRAVVGGAGSSVSFSPHSPLLSDLLSVARYLMMNVQCSLEGNIGMCGEVGEGNSDMARC